MAGETLSMIKLKQIFLHRHRGTTLEGIAKVLACSRNTVKKYIRLAEEKKWPIADLLAKDDHELERLFSEPAATSKYRYADLEEEFERMETELKRVGVTRWILWGEYKTRHPDGYAYSLFYDYFRSWQQKSSVTAHFEHLPGDKAFVDFTGQKLYVTDPSTGEITGVEVYVAVLGFSGLTYVEAVLNQRKEVFIKATENALRYFCGVPKAVVPDNLKSAVTLPDKYDPEINEAFLDFSNHYQTTILPARSRKPRDKAMVEGMVSIVYTRIFAPLRDRTFTDIRELNKAIGDELSRHNHLPLQKERCSRWEKFSSGEAQHMGPLPKTLYAFKRYKTAKVMKNGHIQVNKHYYSVPYRYIGYETKVIYTTEEVNIFLGLDRTSFHRYGLKPFGYTTEKDHLPSTHRFMSEWTPEKFTEWAGRISPEVKSYIEGILAQKMYPEQAYRSCIGILTLETKIGKERFIQAIRRAHYYQIYHYRAVKKIIDGGLDTLFDQEQAPVETTLPHHKNIRGKESFQ